MTSGQDDRIEGTIDEIKGRAKSAIGNVTGDDKLKASGEIDQVTGKAKQAVGDLKDKAGHVLEDIGRAIREDRDPE